MANELKVSYASGLTAGSIVVTLRNTSSLKMWNTNTVALENNNNSNVAHYAVVLTDRGGDLWTADMPSAISAGPYLVSAYFIPSLTLAVGDTPFDSETIGWNGTAVTGTDTGANAPTVGDLYSRLTIRARNAGVSDLNDQTDGLVRGHMAIQDALSDFIRQTKCTRQTNTLDITEADSTVDFSGIVGWHPERWLQAQLFDADDAIKVARFTIGDITDIEQRRFENTTSGIPCRLGFTDYTTATLDKDADADYTLRVIWWPPLTLFTAGDDSAGTANTVLNVTADLAVQVIDTLGVAILRAGQMQDISEDDRLMAAYKALVDRSRGSGNLGAKSIETESVDSVRRWASSW